MILPRFIRFRDAPSYLGMDEDRFNAEVRPCLVEIPIGKQGVAFDRLDLDAWADEYRAREGRPGAKAVKEIAQWDGPNQQDSSLTRAHELRHLEDRQAGPGIWPPSRKHWQP
jgi:hypothetical protein